MFVYACMYACMYVCVCMYVCTCQVYFTFVLSSWRPRYCQQHPNLFCCDCKIYVNPAWSVILAHCHFDVTLLPPWPLSDALPAVCILFATVLFVLLLFRFSEDFFPTELKWADFLRPNSCLALAPTTQSCIVFASSSQLDVPCSGRLSHISTVGPSNFPQKSRSPRPADWKKGGADIAASSSILVARLICYTAAAVLVILPMLVICFQLPPTLFVRFPSVPMERCNA